MKAGIAGGGIMGRLLAFSLLQAGWEVTLFDQGGHDNCSQTAAGLLTPLAELEKNDLLIYELGEEAVKTHWPQLIQQFNEEIFFQKKGSLVLSHPRDHSELTRMMQIITSKITDKRVYQHVNQSQIINLEPQVTQFHEGVYFPDEGQLDAQRVMLLLEGKLQGCQWFKNTWVSDIQPGSIITKAGNYRFDMVFDCRGLGAQSSFDDLRSIRGEIVWLHAPEVVINRPVRLMHPRYSLYIVPKPNQIYLIGASEIESHDASAISVRTMLELLTAAYSVHSGFSEARIVKTMTHCRPTLSNHLPKIKYCDGFAAINGLYRHGYLIAPTLVREVLKWIQQGANAVNYPQLWEKCA